MPSRPTQTPPLGGVDALVKDRYRALLTEARERTLALVEPVSSEDLERVHSPLMSPLVWDLGHIAAFEDLWLCQQAGGLAPLRPELSEVYDATLTPRTRRGDLPYLGRNDALGFMVDVRERALEVLARVDLGPDGDRLNRDAFVWEMIVRHEHQHNETMLQTLALAQPGVYRPERRPLPGPPSPPAGTVRIDAGPVAIGAPEGGFAYDNERPRHAVETAAFEIDRAPVTNGAYLEFIEDGGYHRPELWSEAGRAWLESDGAERPLYWTPEGRVRSFERIEPLRPELPVMHVSYFEAEAFARWRGARLPTELEWEKAASWDAALAEKRAYPWGDEDPDEARANLDQLAFGPAPAGAYPKGSSPSGCLGLIGDCWEWTASDFMPYPGFRAFPYREYSEIFFGGPYQVLRGGSWATRPRVASPTFRNWDYPQRRQIFAGFRCVVDVSP